METTDQQLLEKAKGGDPKAMEELLARHETAVYRFGLRMCGNEDDAREVLQETLLAAFKGLGEFRGDAAISTWLYQIARSFCLRSRRTRVGEPKTTVGLDSREAREVHSSDNQPDLAAHARQIGGLLQAAILSLPEQHREVVVLRDVQGLSAEEAAAALDIEVRALKSRLHRARVALREQLSSILESNGVACEGQACSELVEELASRVGADIDQSHCARVEQHLATCRRCTGVCATLKRTLSLCRSLPSGEVPEPVQAAVRSALRSLQATQHPHSA